MKAVISASVIQAAKEEATRMVATGQASELHTLKGPMKVYVSAANDAVHAIETFVVEGTTFYVGIRLKNAEV